MLSLVGFVTPTYAIESCNCVAFRLDDIQDYWLDDVQTKIINTFQEKNASLTIGIIANYFGLDNKIVDLVKQRVHGSPLLEIANHGWNHEHFATFTENGQWWLLHQANQKILNVTGIMPDVFITPYDSINNDTFQAARENNLKFISANETSDPPPYPLENASLFRLPYVGALGDLNKNATDWINYDQTHVHSEILRGLLQYGYAVVVLHPQDFSMKHRFNYTNTVNSTRIDELSSIMDQLRSENIKIVTMSEIPNQSKLYVKYPSWLDIVSHWDFKGNVSSAEFTNLVDFLKDQKLVTTSLVSSYPVHKNISATYFWVGEPASADNDYINNLASAWDSQWVQDFGGVDDPTKRDALMPLGFHPHENPFYVALPYDDFADNGTRKPDVNATYWYHEKNWQENESMVKNTWVMITKGDKTAYAQWEDAGPFQSDDLGYVFGSATPQNTINKNAGIDLSPATWDYLGLEKGIDQVSWQFVNYANVPDGPWKNIVTVSQVNWSH
ncbi:MAG: polysaccharide deacetylase family protein [Thaumarchaeota archaeon]|nr:polysaccharide deacetylase family protein [Nitrososphaerota archaeon]MDE1867120.1 polysaccharide deacetylase family protein [Nitrososphaerota archaeon]